MTASSPAHYIAFEGERCIATGELKTVALAAKKAIDQGPLETVLVFDGDTSALIELDLRGTSSDVIQRIDQIPDHGVQQNPPRGAATTGHRGPGRPRLGVVAREVTLLPRHWDWLASQPGGASVALRKLVEEARRANAGTDRAWLAKEAAYRFMTTIAGNEPNYEEALRALFAADAALFSAATAPWPADVRNHASRLAAAAFEQQPATVERAR